MNPTTKAFDTNHPDIQYDAAHPDHPRTAFGAMIAALARRRANGTEPFTCQSCDNLQGNGDILRQTLVSLARLSNPDLADWINRHCTFPNSMVDCIVPATSAKELQLVARFGIEDAAPVTHENFRQWVIEDDFCAGRPEWNKVGATFSDEVHKFEAMKIRILNGGHQIIANAGEILSLETISECMEHPRVGALFHKIALSEIAPLVKPVPKMTPKDYVALIRQRFSNPAIVDTVRRVAFDGSSRQTGFIIPTLRDALRTNAPVEGLALSQAIWARMCEGSREDGSIIAPNDPIWASLNAAAKAAKLNPRIWLEQKSLYGNLIDNTIFQDTFTDWILMIWRDGLETTIQTYL